MSKIKLYTGRPSTSAASLYASSNVVTTIDAATACNATGAAQTLTLHLVPSGGSADDTNVIIDAKSIAAGETVLLAEMVNHGLDQGDAIYGLASAADAITLHISGRVG